jgi:agmatine/peptidylarginine deiminase
LLNFRFNGWGGKYRYAADERLAEVVHAAGALGAKPMERVDFVLEGGSVESDGTGTLLTTSRCLLNPNRNPGMSQERIEALLLTKLGADRVLWLDYGYAEGDDTDAHVDTLARFCSPDTIAYTTCDRTDDPLYGEFAAMAEQLRSFKTRSGVAYRLIPLPIPGPIYAEDGQRLPATYANFLIINGAVLLPVYNDPKDKVAMEQLALCFPGRAIVAIDCRVLIRQFGSLHCMTMQFPESSEDG